MKYISGFIFFAGFIIAGIGLCIAGTDLLCALLLGPIGVALMFVGWLLDDLFVEVEDDYTEYLRHVPKEL